jgi:hypothetical protein
MTFDQCVNALIVIAKSGASRDEAIDRMEILLDEYFVSYLFDKSTERGRLAQALGDNAPEPSLTLIPLMQAYLVRVALK